VDADKRQNTRTAETAAAGQSRITKRRRIKKPAAMARLVRAV
jgi:hypothetical protein